MLTVEPREPQSSLGRDDFRKELIRRFFNPQSYFFLCVSKQLQNVPSIAKDINEDDYLLIGQVLEELVQAGDVSGKLELLSKLRRFQDFCEYLEEGVLQLRELEPSPETMKQTIQGMAHFMVDTLIDILHEAESREQLVELIGKRNLLPSADRVDINESLVDNLYTRTAAEEQQPMMPTEEDIASPFQQDIDSDVEEEQFDDDWRLRTERPVANEPPTAQVEPVGEDVAPATGEVTEDFSFGLQDEVKAPLETAPPAISSNPATPAEEQPADLRFREPQAMHDHANRQILGIIKQVLEEFSEADKRSAKKTRWPQLRKLLQSLRETAMINGLEEVEELAFKGWRLLDVRAQKNIALGPPWRDLYKRLGNSLESFVRENRYDMPDLQQLSATFAELIEHPENIRDLTVASAPQRKQDVQNVVVVSPDEANPRNFKLPGEDDAELISLISEVRRERIGGGVEEMIAAPLQAPPVRKNTAGAVSAVGAPPKMTKTGHKSSSLPHPLVQKFHEETDIYFEIADEAIRNLRAHSNSRLALDSLELAAYSLKSAARKLGAEACARFPEHVEEFVKGSILDGNALDESQLQIIRGGFEHLKQSGALEEIEGETMRNFNNQILKLIKTREGARGESGSGQKTNDSRSSAKQPSPEDAVDFLMADDLKLEP
jgi:hypothetical protein